MSHQLRSREQSLAWTVTLVLGVLILIPSMLGFVMKFLEFAKLAEQSSGGAGLAGDDGHADGGGRASAGLSHGGPG